MPKTELADGNTGFVRINLRGVGKGGDAWDETELKWLVLDNRQYLPIILR
jgi:hypothetical protein